MNRITGVMGLVGGAGWVWLAWVAKPTLLEQAISYGIALFMIKVSVQLLRRPS